MKKTKIVVPALAVLLLSTAASVSGTVAWFSMNTQIKVTGMTVTTKVSSSLQIAEENKESEFNNADLLQTLSGKLEPASTINGHNYFYTTDARSDGDARTDTYETYSEATTALGTDDAEDSGKTYYDADFNEAYGFNYSTDSDPVAEGNDGLGNGDVAFAYIDYSFYLKAYTTASEKISLSRVNMKYGTGALTSEHAWRVAFFAHELGDYNIEEDNATTTGTSGALKTILNFAESKNQNQVVSEVLGNGVSTSGYYTDPELQTAASGNADGATTYYKAATGELDPKAIGAASGAPTAVLGRDTTNHVNNKAEFMTGSVGNHIYKVVVRLWLEGEDVTCTSDTFADLADGSWTLDLGFKLGSEYDGAALISNNE